MAEHIVQQLGNYRLIKLLGEGGFAEVYLGEHIHMSTYAAVKVLTTKLTPDMIEQFRNEARTIFSLEHPHIVRVHDYSLNGNKPYIVMHYAANGSLRKRHPRGTRVSLQTVVEYVKQVAAALQYAHDEGLVHRDVKPDNMLIGKHDEILLSDFGIVTVSATFNPNQSQDQIGTWTYMAPEQIKRQAVRASDQYALGITVYEWLCGKPPFEGDWYNLYHQHLNVSPQPLRERVPDLPPNVEQVVMTTLVKDPKQRFASVQDFATALEQAAVLPQKAIKQFYDSGEKHRLAGQYHEALNDYNQVLALDRNHAETLSSRGVTKYMLDDYKGALQDLNASLEKGPGDAFALKRRGNTKHMLDDYKGALQDLNASLEKGPGDAWTIGTRGQVYQAMRKDKEALADFEQALALDSSLDWVKKARDEVRRRMK